MIDAGDGELRIAPRSGPITWLLRWLVLRWRLAPSRATCIAVIGRDLRLYRTSSRFALAHANTARGAVWLVPEQARACAGALRRHRAGTLGREGLPDGFRLWLSPDLLLGHDRAIGIYALIVCGFDWRMKVGVEARPGARLTAPIVSVRLEPEEADALVAAMRPERLEPERPSR